MYNLVHHIFECIVVLGVRKEVYMCCSKHIGIIILSFIENVLKRERERERERALNIK